MKRKLTLAMLLSLTAASPLAQALGLADAEVRSTLDAPLRATIPLTDSGQLRPGLLKVSVADARAFQAAGLERTPLAASVSLDVRRRQGRLVLDLSTQRAVRSPWLDLLLRFDWPEGQQLHEVTLLLDPPDYDQMPALVERARPDEAATSSPSFAQQAELEPSALASSPVASSFADDATVGSSSAGPAWVRPGDTLWAVAGRLLPDAGISRAQMMIALVEANPEAFVTGNIHGLRAGYRLTVPPRETILTRSDAVAARAVEAMTQAWARREEGAPAPAGPEDAGPRLTLLTEAQASGDVSAGDRPAGGDSAADDRAGSTSAAGAPAGGDEERGEAARLDRGVLEALYGWGEPGPDTRLHRLEQRWQESRDALAAARAERDALQAALGAMREELEALRGQLTTLETVAADGPVVQAAPSQEAGWRRVLPSGGGRALILGGAGVVALLGLLAWVRHRRRREEAPQVVFDPSRSVGQPPSTAIPPGERHASPTHASMPRAEAINEADIFIAYGRYEQARGLLEDSLAHEPERDDLRLKLLGVQLEQGDHQAAHQQAERLRARGEPAILAEVERLLARRPEASAPQEGAEERAAAAQDTEAPSGQVAKTQAQEPVAGVPAATDPEATTPAPVGHDEAGSPEAGGEPRMTSASTSSSPLETDRQASVREAAHAMPTRRSHAGPQVIDYRPPALDPNPHTRQETPMQPSVEFPTSGATSDDDSSRGPGATPPSPSRISGLEVEEVAFPSLERDNAQFHAAASSPSTLAEARRLIDVEAPGRARALLENLIDESDDPDARKEARELLDHLP